MKPRLVPASTTQTEEPEVEKSVGKKPVDVRTSSVIDKYQVPYLACLKGQKYAKEYGHFLDMFT